MATFVIFVGGAGTEPDPLPVFFVDSGEHAARICEGIETTEFRIYKFTFHEVSKSDLSKFPFWAEMTIDARDGIYGEIVAGIYDMIDRAYAIISQRRKRARTVNTTGEDPNSSTVQEETDDRRLLEELERKTPELDTESIDWIAARKENQEKLGYPTSTLSTYRLISSGGKQLTAYFGIDKDGRRWRRHPDKTKESMVYYFAADVAKYQTKASN